LILRSFSPFAFASVIKHNRGSIEEQDMNELADAYAAIERLQMENIVLKGNLQEVADEYAAKYPDIADTTRWQRWQILAKQDLL
jgi:hypothetical protein